ncbi:zinc finger protein OZF-like [Aricia agestis]|uniref:zinc finger protein OZF-like n=1 Tax=Aricia agestis TaxID=91739 RepID=UPI001C207D69|nr:zinc finger protein OZF-like [Aricia agestis]
MSSNTVFIKTEPENYVEIELNKSEYCDINGQGTSESDQDLKVPRIKNEQNVEFITIKAEPSDFYGADSEDFCPKPESASVNIEITIKQEEQGREGGNGQLTASGLFPTNPGLFISDVSNEILNLNSKIDGKFVCPICQKTFTLKGNLQRHLTNHKREKFECNVCFRPFYKKEHLEKHMIKHLNIKHACETCGKEFRSLSSLEQHKRTHLGIKPFQCDKCDRQYTVKTNLIKHLSGPECKKKEPEGELQCHVCNKMFLKKFLLQSHLKRHSTERPFKCSICHSNYKYKSTVLRHEQLHKGIKPYSCKICRKTFTHPGLIKPHMRKHTGEKPYQCDLCLKWFSHKHNLQRHMPRHMKIKHVVCDICSKVFPKESRLKYHMRTHTKEKPFACYVCPKTFSHKQNIVRHYSRKHPNEKYECTFTDASVARECWDNVFKQKMLNDKAKEDLIDGC